MKKFMRIILITILIFVIIMGAVQACIIYYAKTSVPQKADVIIVLGCQIWGWSPSWLLEYRLNKALELYKKAYADNIIVSGGQGKDEKATESSVMKAWLVSHGVDENKIIEENRSTSTYENLSFSKSYMEKYKYTSAIIVSNDFHIFRSLKIAEKLDILAYGAPAPTLLHLRPYYHLRESLAIIKYYFSNDM